MSILPHTTRLDTLIAAGQLPSRITELLDLAATTLRPRRVWLFGSRARKDHQRFSDIDLAFQLDDARRPRWSAFVGEVEDSLITLLGIDLVDIDRCDSQLAKQVRAEGIVIYEEL